MNNTLKKNSQVILHTTTLLQNGNALAHTEDGFVVFVPAGAPDETVKAQIIKVTKTYAVAKILEIIQPSSHRTEDGCPFAGKCGGCVFCHIDYDTESLYKKTAVNDALSRIGGLDLQLSEYFPAQNTVHYRNKAVFPVGQDKDGRIISGFYARNTHRIVNADSCLIGKPEFDSIKSTCLAFMEQNKISAYDEISCKGLVRSIHLRASHDASQVSLTLILNGKSLVDSKTEKIFCDFITKNHPCVKTVLINVNDKNTNAVLGDSWRTIYGDGCIYDTLCGKNFRITPASFWQINHAQTQVLYSKAKEYANLQSGETLLDLYCGTGTVGLCIAEPDTKLFGVEIIPQAVKDANINAKLNGMNAEFMCLDAATALDDERVEALHPDVITIDPPRKGCADAVEKIAGLGAKRIVYISCDPATLARDLAQFEKCGYKACHAAGVDMFPRTGHVETVVLLSQLKPDDVIQVELNSEDLALTSTEAKATYEEIKTFVKRVFGFKVSSLYIAQVKRKYGIEVGQNYNISKKGSRVPICPQEKEDAIVEALRYFKMIK